MADVAWVELQVLDSRDGQVYPTLLSENNLGRFDLFRPAREDDYRVGLGIKVVVTTMNGDRLFLSDTFEEVKLLLKDKVK